MRYVWIGLILYVITLLEGSAVPWIIPAAWNIQVMPHLVLIAIIFVAVYLNRYAALSFGLIFGLLQDVVYGGHMLGPHSFSMGLIGYAAGLITRRIRAGIWMMLLLAGLCTLVYEIAVYETYILFRVIDVSFRWNMTEHILPDLLVNLFFTLIVYIPARRLFERLSETKELDETSA